jgi:hypothetical protein
MNMNFKVFAFGFMFFLTSHCYCQVSNDGIQNRIALNLDSGGYHSSTKNSGVEWDCINKALTNKCLVYHNDQWFTIKPSGPGPYYLNVSQQHCKKSYGVQLVIIEGDPCQSNSYRLIKCIPFTDQSDFFVRLDSLLSNKEYLVNVDGYLGDFCDFKIAFSLSYQGIPVDALNQHAILLSMTRTDSLVDVRWDFPDTLSFQINQFEVFRKRKNEKRKIATLPVVYNAYGVPQKKYCVSDTIRQYGAYAYVVFGKTSAEMLLLAEGKIIWQKNEKNKLPKSTKRQITYYVRKNGLVKIQVLDGVSNKRLFSMNRTSIAGRNILIFDFESFVEKGILSYTVVIDDMGAIQEYPVNIQR